MTGIKIVCCSKCKMCCGNLRSVHLYFIKTFYLSNMGIIISMACIKIQEFWPWMSVYHECNVVKLHRRRFINHKYFDV